MHLAKFEKTMKACEISKRVPAKPGRTVVVTPFALLLYSLLFILLECHLDNVRSTYTVLRKNVLAHKSKSKILVLGSSHSQFGINAYKFSQPTLNMANVSQSLQIDRLLAEKLIAQVPNLKLVILPISYFATEYRLCDSQESWRDYYYNHFLQVSERPFLEKFLDAKYWSLISMYGPNICRRAIFSQNTIDLDADFSDEGLWRGQLFRNFDQSDKRALERANYHLGLMHSKYGLGNKEHLQALVKVCRLHSVEVVFITIPTMTNYRTFLGPKKINEAVNIINSVSSITGVHWKDYSDDNRFAANDFRDNDHLNASGAALFTKILDQDFVQPFFKEKSKPI